MPDLERRDAGTNFMRAFTSIGSIDERSIDESARTIDFVCSTEDEDGHGTVIDQASWKLDRYARNPVVLWNHNSAGGFLGASKPKDEIPIARGENVRVDGGKLRARFAFPPAGEFELSDHVWNALKSRRLNACSVGFRPGKVAKETVDGGRERYRLFNCTLFEISVTPLPSNAYTVAERSALAKLAGRAEMPECSLDDCVGPDGCVADCPCECHIGRAAPASTTITAPSAPTETRMPFLDTLSQRLGCTATEADILAALDAQRSQPEARAMSKAMMACGVACDDCAKACRVSSTESADCVTACRACSADPETTPELKALCDECALTCEDCRAACDACVKACEACAEACANGDAMKAVDVLRGLRADLQSRFGVVGELISAPSISEEFRALVESLGLPGAAPVAEITRAIVQLQSRAAKADELEPKVTEMTAALAKRDEAEATREVDFLVKRGSQYGHPFDERARKGLLAYRKADPAGFAEDYKAVLDGLRAFDDSAMFASVTAPKTAPTPSPDAMATRAVVVDAVAEIERVAGEMVADAAKRGVSMSRADALESARKKIVG